MVTYLVNDHTAWITLASPATGNTLHQESLCLLKQYIDAARQDCGVRLIILQGQTQVFCRGMDFTKLLHQAAVEEFTTPYMDTVMALRDCEKPVLTFVDGDVLAGGMGLVCASDIVLATENASFGLSEVFFGLIPAYVLPLLLERVPFKKARYLALSARRIKADEAHTIGLVDEVIPAAQSRAKLREYRQRLLFSSPDALGLVKSYTDTLLTADLKRAMLKARIQLEKLLMDKQTITTIREFQEGGSMPWNVGSRKQEARS